MDVLARFPRVWCPTCNKTQPMIFEVMKTNDKNDHDAADIVCDECKSVIATLHGPSAHRAGVTDRAAKARAMAGQEIDRLSDPSATECMSSEHFGQLAWQFKRMSGSSGLKVQAAIAC